MKTDPFPFLARPFRWLLNRLRPGLNPSATGRQDPNTFRARTGPSKRDVEEIAAALESDSKLTFERGADGSPVLDYATALRIIKDKSGHSSAQTKPPASWLVCKQCGQKFDPKNPGQCSYHPQEAKWIGGTGPPEEGGAKYVFPCCGQEYDAYEHELDPGDSPPRSPGCTTGKHEA